MQPAAGEILFGKVVQLSISNGGMPKRAVAETEITRDGLPGDWQKNRKYHGGPDRAVCLFSAELYDWLRKDHGLDLIPGSVGENVTTSGLELMSMQPGDQLSIGEAVIEITGIRVPCQSLKIWHVDLHKIIKGRSGWVAKTVSPGMARTGDRVEYLSARKPTTTRITG